MPLRSVPDDRAGVPGRRFASRRTILKAAWLGSGAVAASGVGVLASLGGAKYRFETGRLPPTRLTPEVEVSSPNGRLTVRLQVAPGVCRWAISYDGASLTQPSQLAYQLPSGATLVPANGDGIVWRRRIRDIWDPPYGRRATFDLVCNEVTVDISTPVEGVEYSVVVRAYDAGAAARIVLRDSVTGFVTIAGEASDFQFVPGSQVWASRDESEYRLVAPNRIPVSDNQGKDRGRIADVPLTVRVPTGALMNLSESAREHFPRLLFSSDDARPDGLALVLATSAQRGGGEEERAFDVTTPFEGPWRTVTVGRDAVELMDNADLASSLGRPNVLGNVDWIRGGKAFRAGLSTAEGIAAVELAVARNLDFVHFDTGWYGPEGDRRSDATKPIKGLDMPAVIAYARERGKRVILYVNRLAAERQLAEIAQLYRQWGVAGVKLGFVHEGTQAQNDLLFNMIKTLGEQRLLVILHDDVRPSGQERTLPNYITMEGVRGNEHFPTATHNVTLPFTRNISGPMDYTICYRQGPLKTTGAHQLAMAVVYYSPITWLYWYAQADEFVDGPPELDWFDKVPQSWDESRTLAGSVGEYVVVTRRSRADWYLGAMTNERGREVTVSLDFLGPGGWTAHVFADGPAASEPRRTAVEVRQQDVTGHDQMTLTLAPSGGQAVRFERT